MFSDSMNVLIDICGYRQEITESEFLSQPVNHQEMLIKTFNLPYVETVN